MSRVDPLVRGELALQLLLGLLLGSLHLSISLQTAISAAPYSALVRTLILMLYPLALALTGLGALLVERWTALGGGRGLRGAGLLLLAFLGASLRLPLSGEWSRDLPLVATTTLLTLGGWYLLMGAVMADSLQRLREHAQIPLGWATHLAGLMIGYGLSELAVVEVGANAVLAVTGAALLLGGRQLAFGLWSAGLVAAAWTQLDRPLEQARDLGVQPALRQEGAGASGRQTRAALHSVLDQTLWIGWGRLSQVRLVPWEEGAATRSYGVFYNFAHQYGVNTDDFEEGYSPSQRRAPIYAALEGVRPVLLISAGAGRGLLALPGELDEGVLAVERDPAAMRLFREIAPELNAGIYDRVRSLAEDGRSVLERLPGPWGAIVVESGTQQPVHVLLPASAPHFLQTTEAIEVMIDRLAPEGTLILEYARTGEVGHRGEQATRALRGLQEAGLETRVLAEGHHVNLFVMACKPTGCGEELEARVRPARGLRWLDLDTSGLGPPLTDDRPFFTWLHLTGEERRLLQIPAWAFVLLALGVAARERLRFRSPEDWHHGAAFVFAVGVGHIALQLHAFHLARTYFTDSVRTILVMIVLFLAWGALGSALADRLRGPSRSPSTLTVAALLLAAHWALITHLPTGATSAGVRWGAALLATAPGGLLMGAVLPLGLRRASPRQLRGLVAVDAAGTLAGYALIYPVMLPHGAFVYGVVAVGCYLVACGLLGTPPTPDSSPPLAR